MYVQEMIDLLGLRTEDAAHRTFSIAAKLDALNLAQKTLVNRLHNAFLTELETKEFNKTTAVASGDDESSFAISSLSNPMIRNGLIAVRKNGGKLCHLMQAKDIMDTENPYLVGTDDKPIAYLYRNRIYVQTTTADPSIDIWYLKEPSDLKYKYITDSVANADQDTYCRKIEIVESDLTSITNDYYNGSVIYNVTQGFYAIVRDYIGSSKTLHIIYNLFDGPWVGSDEWYFIKGPGGTEKLGDFESELNEALHELLIDMAEAHLWRMANKADRAGEVYSKAIDEINILNARYEVEKPLGVGN